MFLQELKNKAAKKGRTLSSICDELGIHRSVIARWEKEAPSSICDELGIHRSVIARWEKEAPKSIKIYQRLQQAIERL